MASEAPRAEHRERDLILLVADTNMEYAVRGLLSRPASLKIRAIEFTVIPHPERDPGVRLRADDFLKPFRSRYRRAMALFDREGCGRDDADRSVLEKELEERLAVCWGGDRSAVVVLDPELETWVWSDSPHVANVLGWKERDPDLRSWLRDQRLLEEGRTKPESPKKAMEKALRAARKPRSSALYRSLAEQVGLARCTDPSFLRFCQILRDWFAP